MLILALNSNHSITHSVCLISTYGLIDIWCLTPLSVIFQLYHGIMGTSFSGGRSRSTRREPPTMGKKLVSFITYGCESSPPFFVIYKAGREATPSMYQQD